MTGGLHRAFRWLADLCWPRTCAVEDCARLSDRPGRHLCSACLAAMPFYEPGGACHVCDAPVAARVAHRFVCEACAARPPAYARLRSAVRFEEPARSLLLAFKYHRATWLAEDLADLLEGVVRARLESAAVDVVAPVPLHPHRLRARGYNQAALLARALARRLNRRFDDRALVRTRDTEHQARLGGDDRRTNLRDAFAVVRPDFVRGRTVLLVDDVTTTGSTLACCAQPLVAAGAAAVWCATVARSLKD